MRIATPSPKRRDSPCQPAVGVPCRRTWCGWWAAPAAVGIVHDVVVEERERVHQLEGRTGVGRSRRRLGRRRRRRSPSGRTRAGDACRPAAPAAGSRPSDRGDRGRIRPTSPARARGRRRAAARPVRRSLAGCPVLPQARWAGYGPDRRIGLAATGAQPSASGTASSPSRSATTSSIRTRAAVMRDRQTAINSAARATRSASRSTSTSELSSSRQDAVELAQRLCVTRLFVAVAHWPSLGAVSSVTSVAWLPSTRLVTVPSASSVTSTAPAVTSACERTTRPSACG